MKGSCIFALLLLLGASKIVAETYPAVDFDPEAYHFFVGIELGIPYESSVYPLLGLKNNSAVIKVDGQTVLKPIRKIDNFQAKKSTKFSTNFIEVEEFTCTPGYSLEADPELRAMRTNVLFDNMSNEATDAFDNAMRSLGYEEGHMSVADADTSMDGGERRAHAREALASAREGLASATTELNAQPGYVTGGRLGAAQYDQLNVSIRLKAVRPMEDPVLVMVVKLKDREDGKVTASWMHFRALGRITTSLSTISFSESSYPDGKLVDSAEIYLFSGGSEIATNLSPKRVDLSEEQIRNFANFQYTAQNTSKTLPPLPAWYVLDPKIFRNTDPQLLDATFNVTIDENGVVTQVRTDAIVDSRAIASIKDLMDDLIFYPALDKGNPVTGSLEIRLKDYLL